MPDGTKIDFDMGVIVDVEFGNNEIIKLLSTEIDWIWSWSQSKSVRNISCYLNSTKVMKFAFDAMVKSNEDNYLAGKIYELNDAPLVDNSKFLNN